MGDFSSTSLPPGFRFFPSDQELVLHFLYRKAAGLPPFPPNIIPTLDLHHSDPWDLHGKALQGGNKWYFFTHGSTHRCRASPNGHWKPVGIDEPVMSGNGGNVGLKKTLVFYVDGEDSEGIETNWVMHEFHLLDGVAGSSSSSSRSSRRSSKKRTSPREWVVCRVYEAACGSQVAFSDDGGIELSCLDEVFLSFDDLDEVSLPN